MAHLCVACAAPLEPEDGHDSCPPCLGLEHLRESLTDSACMNCSLLPWVLRVARLAELENRAAANDPSALMSLPPNQPGRSGRQRHDGAAAMGAPPKKKARGGLAARVDGLASDMEQIQSLLLALQPGTGQGLAGLQPGPPPSQFDDALSLAASANLFNEVMTEGDASHTLDEASCSSAQGSLQGAADTSMAAVLRTALARLQLDAAQTESAQASAFFRRNPVPATFPVPPSEEYLKELHACWRDTRALSHSTSDARTLAAMQNAAQVGLGRMPSVEPAIASLILAPDEALRPNARCPRPQCRVTDNLLSCHLITPVAYEGLSGLHNSPRMAFGPPNAYLPGSSVPHNPTDAPPEPQEAGGAGARPSGPVVGCFSHQQLSYWAACTSDPWVVSTLTQGMVPFILFLQLLGKLTAASAVVPLGLLSLRPMQMWLNSLHLDPKWHRHQKLWAWPLHGPTHC
ncbi:unnamed protein product [Boreogadus saida]